MADERYYWLDDPEHGVSHEELGMLSPDEQREYMLAWFGRMFEDPANETPFQSSEGGYIYIWGGPYDAREQIENEFYDVVSEDLLNEVIDEVETDGISDWAPGPHHPDHVRAAEDYYESMEEPEQKFEEAIKILEAGGVPVLGADAEVQLRSDLASSANNILAMLQPKKPEHGGMGHNQPPIDDDEYALPFDLDEVHQAAKVIATEASKETPDALAIAEASSRLAKLRKWGKEKADAAAEEFAKGFGKAAGTAAGVGFVALVVAAVSHLLGISWQWLTAILPVL